VLNSSLKSKSASEKDGGVSEAAVLDAFNILIGAWKDCKNTAEIEKTKRKNIKAWRDVNVKAIEESSNVLKIYLTRSFDERAVTIRGIFERLDRAIETDNLDTVGILLGSIVSIVKESPLAQARQRIADFKNPDVLMIDI